MSHVAAVSLRVRDLDALEAAGAEHDLVFVRGQKTFKWFGRWVNDWRDPNRSAVMQGYDPKKYGRCEHALVLKGKRPGETYEIGVVRREDGDGYDLMYDSWGPGAELERKAGVQLRGLQNTYAAQLSERYLKARGYRTQRYEEAGEILVRGVRS